MKFLLVDDDPQKLATVRSFLIEAGVVEEDVLTAAHAAAARILLESATVDVLLIDVLLPAREGALPRGENSVELLRQIVEDGTTPAPNYIFGMTASKDARAEYGSDFSDLVAQVLHITPGENSWRGELSSLLSLLRRAEVRSTNDYDICVLNALRAPELDSVISSWPLTLGDEKLLGRNILYRSGTVSLNGSNRRIVCAHLSQVGPIAATHATTAVLTEFRPKVLLMTGICGGFADHVSIGDIVVAEKSWDWQAGKWGDGGVLETSLDQRDATVELVAEAKGVEADLYNIKSSYDGNCPDAMPKLVFGPMVTGSSVVASLDIQKVFRDQHRKMVGVDMECYGMYYAASNYSGSQVRVICVKSVSDLADRAKGDDFQVYCSYMSAMVALEIVRRYFNR